MKVGAPLVDIVLDDKESFRKQTGPESSSSTSATARHCSTVPLSEGPPNCEPDGSSMTQDVHLSDGLSGERKGVLASPAVRALAREKGVDLANIAGSGANGRVLKVDVEKHHVTGAVL